jgi:putative addiction module killer protein
MDVRVFKYEDGYCPYEEWLGSLDDRAARVRIAKRMTRVERGHFGDHRALGDGVWELRFHFGPGYRIYFGRVGDVILLLLAGGDKGSQERDVVSAKRLWQQYEEEHGG